MLQDIISKQAETFGIPAKLLSVAYALLSSFPASLIFKRIPPRHETVRHMFSIFLSGFLYCSLFNARGFMEMMLNATLVYVLTFLFRKQAWNPFVVFVLAMAHLSLNHISGSLFNTDADRYDNTGPMMVMVIKLTSFAWSAFDGLSPATTINKDRRIVQYPSYIEFMGYCCFFPGFLVGPACEYVDYQRFVKGMITSSIVPVTQNLLMAFLCLFVFLKFGNSITFAKTLQDDFINTRSFGEKFLYFNAAGFISRTKYYTAWKLSEAACNLVGFGYDGVDKNGIATWTRGQNADILSIEFPENPRMMVSVWNMNTAKWLKNHVYLRFLREDGKNAGIVTVITFVTSGFWHGFKPGFYLTFFFMAFYTMTGRLLRRHVRPLFLKPSKLSSFKSIYDVAGWLMTWSGTNYIVAPFILLKFDDSIACWKSMYFYQHIFMLTAIIGFKYLGLNRMFHHIAIYCGSPLNTGQKSIHSSVDKQEKSAASTTAEPRGKSLVPSTASQKNSVAPFLESKNKIVDKSKVE